MASDHENNDDQGKPEREKGPDVSFEHVGTSREEKFDADWDDTLNALWDKSADLLAEPRKSEDRLQTFKGVDLMPYLGLTLRELKDRKLIDARKFQIVGPTGGA